MSNHELSMKQNGGETIYTHRGIINRNGITVTQRHAYMKISFTIFYLFVFCCLGFSQGNNNIFEYDKLNMISRAVLSNNSIEIHYTYDELGNRTGKTVIFHQRFLAISLFLEGAYTSTTGLMFTTLADQGLLPLNQPFNTFPWNYTGIEALTALPPDIVDWVLVELRDAANPEAATPATVVSGWPRAMLIKSDGNIVDLNGNIPSIDSPTVSNNLYVVIRHRNHLDVMSSEPLVLSENNFSYDFTDALTKAYGGAAGYKQIGAGVFGMVASDIDADGAIGASDFNLWAQRFGLSGVYNAADTDMDGQVSASDFNKWAVNFGEQIIIDGINKNQGYQCQVPINE
jgi:hypothetical protein